MDEAGGKALRLSRTRSVTAAIPCKQSPPFSPAARQSVIEYKRSGSAAEGIQPLEPERYLSVLPDWSGVSQDAYAMIRQGQSDPGS